MKQRAEADLVTIMLLLNNKTIRSAVKDWMQNKELAIQTWGPIEDWDTSRVTDMEGLFMYINRVKIGHVDLSKWDTSQVTIMKTMFCNADSFTSDLSKWNTGKLKDASFMFYKATSFTSDLSKWNVKHLENGDGMFCHASQFQSDLSGWNIKNLHHTNYMFFQAKSFYSDLSHWNMKSIWVGKSVFEFSKIHQLWNISTPVYIEPYRYEMRQGIPYRVIDDEACNYKAYQKSGRLYIMQFYFHLSPMRLQSIAIYC
jgi:surface protein